jgi:hypothetical protein
VCSPPVETVLPSSILTPSRYATPEEKVNETDDE